VLLKIPGYKHRVIKIFINTTPFLDKMGRIKTKLVKNISHNLYSEHAQDFTTDFDENKKLVDQFADLPSKKMRNIVAGFVTRIRKTED